MNIPDFVHLLQEGGNSLISLGIDPSLNSTGIAGRNSAGELLFMTLVPPGKIEGSVRLAWIFEQSRQLMSQPWPTIAIEGYSFASKFSRAHDLGEVGGAFRVTAYLLGHRMAVVPPTTMKKFLCGKGSLEKNLHPMHVLKMWGIETRNDNEADAVTLAQIAYSLSSGSANHRWQLDAIEGVPYTAKKPPEPRVRVRT